MAITVRRVPGFEALRTGHPVSAELEALLDRVAADPVLRGDGVPGGVPVHVRRHVRATPGPDGEAAIDRFCWSAQWRDPEPGARFRARTLLYERRRGDPLTFDFPDDPRLPAAAAPGSPLAAPGAAVLRYVPTQRITFRNGDVVGKMKRPKSLVRAYACLEAAFAAAQGAGVAIPEPRGLDAARGVFYQALAPGRPVTDVIAPANAERILRALGATLGAIHALPLDGVPARDPAALAAVVLDDAAWVAFAAPEHATPIAAVARRLASELEDAEGGERCFCHGDPAFDQVLLAGDVMTMVDFDDATLGDPHADLGTMLAALPLDAPRLFAVPGARAARAIAAYLDGYRERSGRPLDERRLRTHRARAELAFLAGRLHKGIAGPEETAAAVARLRSTVGG